MASIRERLVSNQDWTLKIKVTPEEWMALVAHSTEDPFFIHRDDDSPSFNLEGIIVWTDQAEELAVLQFNRAVAYLESIIWQRDSD